MATHYRTRAFVLKKGYRAEADSSIIAFSEDFGMLRLNATSGRKIVSKLRSGTEPFVFAELEFIRGKALNRVVDSLVIKSYKNIKKDLIALRSITSIADVLIRSVKGEMIDKRVWDLIEKSFSALDDSRLKPIVLYYYFLWNLFSILGYSMEFSNCVLCKDEVKSTCYIDFTEGGVICDKCSVNKNNIVLLETLKIAQMLYKNNSILELNNIKINKQFHDFSMEYRSHILQIMQ